WKSAFGLGDAGLGGLDRFGLGGRTTEYQWQQGTPRLGGEGGEAERRRGKNAGRRRRAARSGCNDSGEGRSRLDRANRPADPTQESQLSNPREPGPLQVSGCYGRRKR